SLTHLFLSHFLTTSSSALTSLISFFNDTATTEIYTLSLHDALPISPRGGRVSRPPDRGVRAAPGAGRAGGRAGAGTGAGAGPGAGRGPARRGQGRERRAVGRSAGGGRVGPAGGR